MALPNKAKIPVGTILAGKYRTTREIGRGGMAAVYEAAHVDIGKRVAIKVLAQELTTSAVVVERFLREARAAAAIRSPYICDVYDSGKLEDGRPFLVLELLEGESLYERMTKARRLDPETTVAVVNQTCRGLTKAHAASIVHRDLKPENIFLTKDEDGTIHSKILDFGLAKFYSPVGTVGAQARLTREGAVFGTPAYMSPEQVRGQGAVDHRADLWALGCIVYECLTGRTVWATDQGVAMTFAQIAGAVLPNPHTHRADLPPAFGAWFERALNRDIEKRFQTAKHLAEELAATFNQQGPVSLFSSAALPSPHSLIDVQADHPPSRASPESPRGVAEGLAALEETVPAKPSAQIAQIAQVPQSGGREPASPSPRPSKLGFSADDAVHKRRVQRKASVRHWQLLVGLSAVAMFIGAGALAWSRVVTTAEQPSAFRSGRAPPTSAKPSAASGDGTAAAQRSASDTTTPPWMATIRDGQQALTEGDTRTAARLFREAFDKGGGNGVARTFLEHLAVATAALSEHAPCQLTGLARPRTYGLTGPRPLAASWPSIAAGPRGAVVTWADAHEGAEHAYAVTLDEALRNAGAPIDVTPEATSVAHPEVEPSGSRFVLSYTDTRGPEAGLRARFLEADGRIGGPSVTISPSPPRLSSTVVSLAKAPDGSFFAAWSDEVDADSEDLFLQHLSPALDPVGSPVRLTDLSSLGPAKARARLPFAAVAGDAVQVSYRLEHEPQHVIEQIRLPLAAAGVGLEAAKRGDGHTDRTAGEVALVNTDKSRADSPVLSCGGGLCFVVWHGEMAGGASAAFIDPTKAQPIWRKRFARGGSRPAVAVSSTGQGQVVWYEAGKVVTAAISRRRGHTNTRCARERRPAFPLDIRWQPRRRVADFRGWTTKPVILRRTRHACVANDVLVIPPRAELRMRPLETKRLLLVPMDVSDGPNLGGREQLAGVPPNVATVGSVPHGSQQQAADFGGMRRRLGPWPRAALRTS